jgi:hypothetical protein
MVSKPPGDWYREDRTVEAARQAGGVALKALSAGTSGIVRVRAVYRASMSAMAALSSAWAALAFGLSGRNIPVAILAAGCSLLMGWMALRNLRPAFGRARSNVEAFSPMPDTAGLTGRHDPWSRMGEVSRDFATNTQRGGSVIYYSRNKLALRAAKAFMACAVLVWVLTGTVHRSPLVTLLVLAGLGFYLWLVTSLLIRCTANDLTAVSWDARQIRVRTLTSSRQVPWQSVESVKFVRRVLRVSGIIPISTSYELMFQLRHNGSRHKTKILASALTITPVAANELVQVALRRGQAGNQNTRVENPAEFSSRTMAASPDLGASGLDAAFARDAAEGQRAFGANGQSTFAPPAFGRKVM